MCPARQCKFIKHSFIWQKFLGLEITDTCGFLRILNSEIYFSRVQTSVGIVPVELELHSHCQAFYLRPSPWLVIWHTKSHVGAAPHHKPLIYLKFVWLPSNQGHLLFLTRKAQIKTFFGKSLPEHQIFKVWTSLQPFQLPSLYQALYTVSVCCGSV